ncbi:hypothetical protein U1Q18_012573 [Sarracenia purpurea var. burkii]
MQVDATTWMDIRTVINHGSIVDVMASMDVAGLQQRRGCNPRVCLPWTSRPSASVPGPSGFSATLGLATDSLVRRRPRLWVRRASLVSPPTLDWGFAVVSFAVLLWFRRRHRTGVSVVLRAFATLGMV